MICLICRLAETVEEFISIRFERAEINLVVSHVPARVCPHCGDAYVEEEVTLRLLRSVEAEASLGISHVLIEYPLAKD